MLGNVIVVLIFLFFIYNGYKEGALRQVVNLLIYFISSVIAGFISDITVGFLYSYLPFLNFIGKSEGLKAINIIFWKLVIYALMVFGLVFLIKKLLLKTKIEDKLIDNEVMAGTTSKILGAVLSLLVAVVISFNVCLILLSPNLNLKSVNSSKLVKLVMKNTPVLSKMNGNLYKNESWIINRINKDDNTVDGFKDVNDDIVSHMSETNLINKNIISSLESKDKLVGTRKDKSKNEEKQEEKQEDTKIEEDTTEDEIDDTEIDDSEIEDTEIDDSEFDDEEFDDMELDDSEFNEDPDEFSNDF